MPDPSAPAHTVGYRCGTLYGATYLSRQNCSALFLDIPSAHQDGFDVLVVFVAARIQRGCTHDQTASAVRCVERAALYRPALLTGKRALYTGEVVAWRQCSTQQPAACA